MSSRAAVYGGRVAERAGWATYEDEEGDEDMVPAERGGSPSLRRLER